MTTTRLPIFQILALIFFTFLTIAKSVSIVTASENSAAAAPHGYVVAGRIKVEGMGARVFPRKTANIQVIWNGGQQVTFVRPDGYFAFQGVMAGTHLLEVSALGYHFSPVRVDVSARLHGQVLALEVGTGRDYSDPLVLKPLMEEAYYEQRKPFSAMALLMSLQGLWVAFMVVALFLLPKLRDSSDLAEKNDEAGTTRNAESTAPSFSSLLQSVQQQQTKKAINKKNRTRGKH